MFEKIYTKIDTNKSKQNIYDFSLKSLNKVQLYLGRPALFFGAGFNGLFSAQVVPNDEIVKYVTAGQSAGRLVSTTELEGAVLAPAATLRYTKTGAQVLASGEVG